MHSFSTRCLKRREHACHMCSMLEIVRGDPHTDDVIRTRSNCFFFQGARSNNILSIYSNSQFAQLISHSGVAKENYR